MAATEHESGSQAASSTDEAAVQRLSIDTIRTPLDGRRAEGQLRAIPAPPMALAPLAYVLFKRFCAHNPAEPDWPDRDRFVLSAGHASMLQYSLLHLTGYDLTLADLEAVPPVGLATPGHPEHGHTAGRRGHHRPARPGLRQRRRHGDRRALPRDALQPAGHGDRRSPHLRDLLRRRHDGGHRQEAASLAGHLELGKLIVFYDDNHITIDGTTSISFDARTSAKRFEAYGWHVQRVDDANDVDALEAAIAAARDETERPSLHRDPHAHRLPRPNAVDTAKSHGAALGEDEVRATKEVMGFDPEREFWVDDSVYEHMSLDAERQRGPAAVEASASSPGARRSPRWQTTGISPGRARCAPAGRRRYPNSRPAKRSRHVRRDRR